MEKQYISIYDSEIIESAFRTLLDIGDGELTYGWITLDSPQSVDMIDLNEIVEPGYYVVYNYINGITNLNMSPVSIRVESIDDELFQIVVLGSDVYHRPYNESSERFDGGWKVSEDITVIHKGEAPDPAYENALWLDTISPIPGVYRYSGEEWIPITNMDYMSQLIYDIEKKEINIKDYIRTESNRKMVNIDNMEIANEDIIYNNLGSDTDIQFGNGGIITETMKSFSLVKGNIKLISKMDNVDIMYTLTDKSNIIVSLDGNKWYSNNEIFNSISNIRFLNSLYIMTGVNGQIFTSNDIVNWEKKKSIVDNNLSNSNFFMGHYLALGNSGTILTSEDTNHWEKRNSDISRDLYDSSHSEKKNNCSW